jgi:hypothetical protein
MIAACVIRFEYAGESSEERNCDFGNYGASGAHVRLFQELERLSQMRICVVRKPTSKELRQLIFRMVDENPKRVSARIRGELKILGYDSSEPAPIIFLTSVNFSCRLPNRDLPLSQLISETLFVAGWNRGEARPYSCSSRTTLHRSDFHVACEIRSQGICDSQNDGGSKNTKRDFLGAPPGD